MSTAVATVRRGKAGLKEGWSFEITYDNRPYASVLSALYKTEIGARRKLHRYLNTGKLDFYGNAE